MQYSLKARAADGRKSLYCDFGDREVELLQIASTGTRSLVLFYDWYLRLPDVSFAFVDDFGAFYHFNLATALVRLLCNLKQTQVLLTTHRTDLMSNDLLRPDCYFLLNENRIAPISSLTAKELREAHDLQRMYKAGAFCG